MMAPESEVAAWWNSLSEAEQMRVARTVCGRIWDTYEWGAWDDLSPFGQQMRIHMFYDDAGDSDPMCDANI